MATESRTLVRLAGETELHRTPLEGVGPRLVVPVMVICGNPGS